MIEYLLNNKLSLKLFNHKNDNKFNWSVLEKEIQASKF